LKNQDEEMDAVAAWLGDLSKGGVKPHEIGIFVRSEAELVRATGATSKAGLTYKILDAHVEAASVVLR
jgi:hypothetical protein